MAYLKINRTNTTLKISLGDYAQMENTKFSGVPYILIDRAQVLSIRPEPQQDIPFIQIDLTQPISGNMMYRITVDNHVQNDREILAVSEVAGQAISGNTAQEKFADLMSKIESIYY